MPKGIGAVYKSKTGYILEYTPQHPQKYPKYKSKRKQIYFQQHRLIMEKHLGRLLLPTEVVHHINGITSDNRIENLQLFTTPKEHASFHHQQKEKQQKERGAKK
jgi:hypothetical protein